MTSVRGPYHSVTSVTGPHHSVMSVRGPHQSVTSVRGPHHSVTSVRGPHHSVTSVNQNAQGNISQTKIIEAVAVRMRLREIINNGKLHHVIYTAYLDVATLCNLCSIPGC